MREEFDKRRKKKHPLKTGACRFDCKKNGAIQIVLSTSTIVNSRANYFLKAFEHDFPFGCIALEQ